MTRRIAVSCLLFVLGCTGSSVPNRVQAEDPKITDSDHSESELAEAPGTQKDPAASEGPSTAEGGSDAPPPALKTTSPARLPPRRPWPMGTRYIENGHSLTDAVMSHPWPGRLVRFVKLDPAGSFHQIAKSTTPGAPIKWRWEHPEGGGDQAAQWPEQMGEFEGLVITAAVPLPAEKKRLENRVKWLKLAVEDAWKNGNKGQGAPTLLYTTWTHLRTDRGFSHPEDKLSFRERLIRDEPRWERMQDAVNAAVPKGQEPLYLIPGHRLMMKLWDDLEAGQSPFSKIDDLFDDNIHTNNVGNYAVSVLHYACIYGRDPVSYLPDHVVDQDQHSAKQARYLKRVVKEVITSYHRTGLTKLRSKSKR